MQCIIPYLYDEQQDESGPFEMKTILMLICVLNHFT